MRVFVTGREGQVARSLAGVAAGDSRFTLHFAARPEVDLLKPETVRAAMAAFRPDIVINPAAYTAVDRAESEPDLAFAINRDGAGAVAAAAAELGAPIIHLSTDYVFDGAKTEPYAESDPTSPQGVYGRSKLEGERAVAAANPLTLIIRTAWVYAPFGGNFLRTMLRLSGERDRLRVVDDQIGCPTYAPDIAWALLSMASQLGQSGWRHELAGVTHLAGADAVTWCGFARLILEAAGSRGGRSVPVDAITTADFPTPARRPANSCLSTRRLKAVFGLEMPSLRSSIDRCLDQLLVYESAVQGGSA
jgi:dTDP-4-dehydrorhamnose reductase